MGPHLISTAGIKYTGLGRANAATGLVGTNTIGEVVVGGAERVGAVVTHPLATGAGRNLKTYTAVRRAASFGGRKNGGDYSEET